MPSDPRLLIPEVVLEAKQRLQVMQAELNRMRSEGPENDRRALEAAVAELKQMIQRHLQ
jgi:hypothetical protein